MTKILFIDNDEMIFQIRQCMARVINQLPPVELFHASDATEGLQLMEQMKPDVVILDDDVPEERDLFLDSLSHIHPPIMVQVEQEMNQKRRGRGNKEVTYITKNDSLEGLHSTLLVATTLATKCPAGGSQNLM